MKGFFAIAVLVSVASATYGPKHHHLGACLTGGCAKQQFIAVPPPPPPPTPIQQCIQPACVAYTQPTIQTVITQIPPPPPPPVVIPRLATPIGIGKPLFHKTGLIQVQLPPKPVITAPAALPAAVQYKVSSPTRGKVVDQTAPTYFCKKPGYILESQDCVQTLVELPRMVCPGGFEGYDGTCVRRAAYLQNCPEGFTRKNGQCAKTLKAQFTTSCPPDTTPTSNGACERQISHPLSPTCPEGVYDARTGTCTIKTFTDARAFCPEGFNYEDGTCVQEEVYDCTDGPVGIANIPQLGLIQQAPFAAPAAATHHHHFKGRVLTGGHHHEAAVPLGNILTAPLAAKSALPAPCVVSQANPTDCVDESKAVVVQATKTTVSVQKTCTRVTSTALIFACEEGALQGQQCCHKQSIPPTPICAAQGDINFCYTTQAIAPLQECPLDYVKECLPGRACECVAVQAAAFIQSCPSGFEMSADSCVRIATAQPVCPPGFALQGEQCLRVLREPADCVFSVTYEYECDPATQSCPPNH